MTKYRMFKSITLLSLMGSLCFSLQAQAQSVDIKTILDLMEKLDSATCEIVSNDETASKTRKDVCNTYQKIFSAGKAAGMAENQPPYRVLPGNWTAIPPGSETSETLPYLITGVVPMAASGNETPNIDNVYVPRRALILDGLDNTIQQEIINLAVQAESPEQ